MIQGWADRRSDSGAHSVPGTHYLPGACHAQCAGSQCIETVDTQQEKGTATVAPMFQCKKRPLIVHMTSPTLRLLAEPPKQVCATTGLINLNWCVLHQSMPVLAFTAASCCCLCTAWPQHNIFLAAFVCRFRSGICNRTTDMLRLNGTAAAHHHA